MTRNQAEQLGKALIAWGRGQAVEVRDATQGYNHWYPFDPGSYEKINADEALEWRICSHHSAEESGS